MAGNREMALGIATAMRGMTTPEPFPLEFRGLSIEDAAAIVLGVVEECADAGLHLHKVMVDPALLTSRKLLDGSGEDSICNVPFGSDPDLVGQVLFYRRPEDTA